MFLKSPKILVVGDLMLDHYIFGNCSRISPEAPVQVVQAQKEESFLGGACNVAHNLVALGAKALLCGIIGEDEKGKTLLALAMQKQIDTSLIFTTPKRPTIQKNRVLVSNQQILRIDYEDKRDLEDELLEQIFNAIFLRIQEVDAIIASDYAKGMLTDKMMQKLIALAKQYHKPILCDPKGFDYSKYKGATLLTPNKKEAIEATGIMIEDQKSLFQALQTLKDQCSLDYSIITLSEDGMGILEKELEIIPTQAQEIYDVTGAGDTVIAALAFALSCGKTIQESCKFANTAAAVVIAKVGSATATLQEIYHFGKQNNINSKIITLEELPNIENIVFTNGCFDILHRGHLQYLQEAKRLGDFLIVGLNSDSSVQALKGKDRPINSQEDRAYLLASLECVDYVIIFDELTPYHLIEAIKPQILVKGMDYKDQEVIGREFAKEVKLLKFVEGKSTTNIIKKIKGETL